MSASVLHGRALPPVAAIIRLLQQIQLFLQPYVQRWRVAREAVQEWWAVREERWVLLSLCWFAAPNNSECGQL